MSLIFILVKQIRVVMLSTITFMDWNFMQQLPVDSTSTPKFLRSKRIKPHIETIYMFLQKHFLLVLIFVYKFWTILCWIVQNLKIKNFSTTILKIENYAGCKKNLKILAKIVVIINNISIILPRIFRIFNFNSQGTKVISAPGNRMVRGRTIDFNLDYRP